MKLVTGYEFWWSLPSLQISSSKSRFLSSNFSTLPSENNFPFIGKFSGTLKSYSDAVNRSTIASLNSYPSWSVCQIVARFGSIGARFLLCLPTSNVSFEASISCKITWTQLKSNKNQNKSMYDLVSSDVKWLTTQNKTNYNDTINDIKKINILILQNLPSLPISNSQIMISIDTI